MADEATKKRIVTTLRDKGPGLGFRRGRASDVSKWARVYSVESILDWSEDEEPSPDAIRASVKKAIENLYPKLEALAVVLKPLLSK